jgi:hypothetical protein
MARRHRGGAAPVAEAVVCWKCSGASLRLVSVAIPSDKWISLHHTDPGQPGYSEELLRRAEEVLNGSSLVEMILYGHLHLEHALDMRIQARFERADVLEGSKFARLGFAHKVTVYVGLYDPGPEWVRALQGFNRLRNRMAHSLFDLEQAALECLPAEFGDVPLQKVRTAFMTLAMGELLAIQGALVDRHQPEER